MQNNKFDLGYSNVNGNTRMNDGKLSEIRKQLIATTISNN